MLNKLFIMGIPRYFKYITNNFNSLIIEINDTKVKINNLYFDMNCLIHPCVREVMLEKTYLVNLYNKEEQTIDKTYKTLFKEFLSFVK